MKEHDRFEKLSELLVKKFENTVSGQMFGKECLKVNGKAFVAFHENKMVFKLSGKEHEKTLSLKGANLWDPSGKKRPMKEWVQVPFVHEKLWQKLAVSAFEYVKECSG